LSAAQPVITGNLTTLAGPILTGRIRCTSVSIVAGGSIRLARPRISTARDITNLAVIVWVGSSIRINVSVNKTCVLTFVQVDLSGIRAATVTLEYCTDGEVAFGLCGTVSIANGG
jgi:Zn-dependent protease